MTASKEEIFRTYSKIRDAQLGEMGCLSKSCSAACEKCCRLVFLLPFEEEFIKEKTGKDLKTKELILEQKWVMRDNKIVEEKFLKAQTLKIIEIANGTCEFFDKNTSKCTNHKNRPIDCRLYPFTIYFQDGKMVLYLEKTCLHADEIAKDKELIKNVIDAWREITPLFESEWWITWSTVPDDFWIEEGKLEKITEIC